MVVVGLKERFEFEMMGMAVGLTGQLEWESREVVGLKEQVEWVVIELVVGWMEKLDWKKAWWFVKDQQSLPGRWHLQKGVSACAGVE